MVVVALVVGLLNNLFFAQRLDEFAVLLAIGWTRRRLLGKVLAESLVIALAAWAVGLALGMATLAAFSRAALAPRAVFIPLVQAAPILVSMALPAVAMLFSAVTVLRRLASLDPVLIIERRG
jgi:ABC-type antimicrobial peptide transport system permease subunit